MSKTKKPTRAQLERKLKEAYAQQAHVYHFADATLNSAEFPKYLASGVMLELTALGGKELIIPVVIRGGLSPETIACLRKDIARSYIEATEFKPSGAKEINNA